MIPLPLVPKLKHKKDENDVYPHNVDIFNMQTKGQSFQIIRQKVGYGQCNAYQFLT